MKIFRMLLVVMLMVSLAVPAIAGRRGRRASEVYLEDPRLENGIGMDIVYNFNPMHAVKLESRYDLGNNSLSGNFDDLTSDGFQVYAVYVLTLK